jgi:DNA-binding transcriptional MerR regulator
LSRHNKPKPDVGLWDERALRQARDWKAAGFSISDIAQALDKNPIHVQMKWDMDGFSLEIKPKDKRKCLSCSSVFDSEGPHNRICDGCRARIATGVSVIEEY